MKLTLTILIILTLVSPATAAEWDTLDKTLLGVLITTNTVDCLQTRWIFDNGWNERNPIITHGVDRFGKAFIPIYFIGSTLIAALIADWLPADYRKAWLGGWVGGSVTAIHRNYSVGIKLRF